MTNVPTPAPRGIPKSLIILLVILLLAILGCGGGIATCTYFVSRAVQARHNEATVQVAKSYISLIKTAIDTYEADNGDFPKNLGALVVQPEGMPNWHQYLEKLPRDPWGNPYHYKCPGAHGSPFDVWSSGPDGKEGTSDDINSWDL